MNIKSERIASVVEETSAGMGAIPLIPLYLKKGIVFLTGTITEVKAEEIISQIFYCKSNNLPVHLLINSGGGAVTAGLAILDVLRTIDLEINTYCIGIAASMAAVILAGGDKGHRFILPHSKVMIHEPLISDGIGGAASSVQRSVEVLLKAKDVLNGILSEFTGKDREQIDEATQFDHFYDANEAKAFGLVDQVIDNPSIYTIILKGDK